MGAWTISLAMLGTVAAIPLYPVASSIPWKKRSDAVLSHQAHNPTEAHRTSARKIMGQWKVGRNVCAKDKGSLLGCSAVQSLIRTLCEQGMPHVAQALFLEMESEGFVPDDNTLLAMMLSYANNGLFPQAQAIWDELLGSSSSFVPSVEVVSELIDAYGKMGHFDEVNKLVDQLRSRNFSVVPRLYLMAVCCFGEGGQLELMKNVWKEMVSRGFLVDFETGNAFIKYYSVLGSLSEMEAAYSHLKRSRHIIDMAGIRAMSTAYIRERKFHRLGEFLRDVGLGRKDVGNLVWNLLLLSYAANFKMKSLQREFLKMLEAGFRPDVTSFNIRALAFSRMSLFWDLHLSLEHMKDEGLTPDLVTYGCVVDAYLDRRLGRNLDFALNKMDTGSSPVLLTDPLVFEVLGKGDFHSSSEAFMEFKRHKKWSYRELIAVYLKKQYRSNQIFWNY